MARWKAPDIVARQNGCVSHALSVMRLALGYKTGWADGVELLEKPCLADVCEAALTSFPGRHVMVIETNADGFYAGGFWEKYLLAYVYRNRGTNEAHMVIGSPYTHTDQVVDLLIAVSVERKWK